MKAPKDTTKIDPIEILQTAMIVGQSDMITNMEKQGQRELVNSDTIPTDIHPKNGKKILESFGFVFGDVVKDDPIFQYCTLPAGWKKEATSHDMHSTIIDEKGRRRIGIFYKAAFYDRCANLNIYRRFGTDIDYDRQDQKKEIVGRILDCDKTVIYETEPITFNTNEEKWTAQDKVLELTKEWLNKNYPSWEREDAYWDLEIEKEI